MIAKKEPLTYKKIFFFWIPLAATWLMMAIEGPFLAAIIARLANPKFNLAAYGVAFSFAVFIEAPVIMMMSASTALAKDRDSYIKLRNFTFVLSGITTLVLLTFIIPPIFYFIMQRLIGLPENVAKLTHQAFIVLIPWPGAIGYRRFYQGILIRSNLTRLVAYGTIIRLMAMVMTSLTCYLFFDLNGAIIGTLSLSVAVSAEAVASRIMTHASVRHLLLKERESERSEETPISYRYITKFYYPLALTSILSIGIHPLVTFFMGQSRMPIESLAVLPVIYSLVFIFRSIGLSFQEVGIALLEKNNNAFKLLRNFAFGLGIVLVCLLAFITLTPFSNIWFHKISGLSSGLAIFAKFPAQIATLLPGLTVLISLQRALLINSKKTKPITIASSIEVISIFIILFVSIVAFNLIGAIAAFAALIVGRLFANGYLVWPCLKVSKRET
jgi:O-antigen/teichoic acid export membrane protein